MYLGTEGDQRRQRRFFVHRSDAEKFVAQKTTTPVPVGELWERKAEILYSLERLRPIGTNLADVVSFYLSHQNITDGQKMVGEVLEEFLREKLQVGRSRNYERNMRKTFTKFLRLTGGDRKIGEITRRQISDYVYVNVGEMCVGLRKPSVSSDQDETLGQKGGGGVPDTHGTENLGFPVYMERIRTAIIPVRSAPPPVRPKITDTDETEGVRVLVGHQISIVIV